MASPLLANVYLHYVFDLWAACWRRREVTGDMIIVRYADDIVVGFEKEASSRRFWEAMRTRLAAFALSLHPEKTRLIEFGRYAAVSRDQRGLGKPETFNFLGFTFICGKSRQGHFQLKRQSRRERPGCGVPRNGQGMAIGSACGRRLAAGGDHGPRSPETLDVAMVDVPSVSETRLRRVARPALWT